MTITGETRLSELLSVYPALREALPTVNPKFTLLNSPMGRILAKTATVAEMSRRSGMDETQLIEALRVLTA